MTPFRSIAVALCLSLIAAPVLAATPVPSALQVQSVDANGVEKGTDTSPTVVTPKGQNPSAADTRVQVDGLGKTINTPYADAGSSWLDVRAGVAAGTYAVKAAAGSGVRNYVTGIQICGISTTVATRVSIKDGSTDMADFEIAGATCYQARFEPPLRGTANTGVNVNTNAAGPVTFNTQGFTAAN